MNTIKADAEVLGKELIVEFEHPAIVKGQKVKQVTFSKPKVSHMKNFSKLKGTAAENEIWLISALTGVTTTELEDFDLDQYALLQEALKNYQRSPIKSVDQD